MSELKTKPNKQSVKKFLEKVTDKDKREDCYTVLKLMKQVTKEEPKMWGNIMVGFERYADLLKKLGKHKNSKSCLYINRLEDINLSVLKELITKSVKKLSKIADKE